MVTKNAANIWYLCMSLVVIMSFLVIICGTIVAVLGGKSRYKEELTKTCRKNSTIMEKFCTKHRDFWKNDMKSCKVEELVLARAIPKYSDYVTPLEEITARVGIFLIKSIVVIFSILVGAGAILRYI